MRPVIPSTELYDDQDYVLHLARDVESRSTLHLDVESRSNTLHMEAAGMSDTLGLEGLQLPTRPTPLDPLPLRNELAPIHALQARIHAALRERRHTTRERVLCVMTPDEEDGVACLSRDQLLPPACASWRFRAGDNLTIIAFLNRKDSIEDSSALLHAAWVPVVSFDNSDLSRAL